MVKCFLQKVGKSFVLFSSTSLDIWYLRIKILWYFDNQLISKAAYFGTLIFTKVRFWNCRTLELFFAWVIRKIESFSKKRGFFLQNIEFLSVFQTRKCSLLEHTERFKSSLIDVIKKPHCAISKIAILDKKKLPKFTTQYFLCYQQTSTC